ncbi:MAG: hypothetical protein ACOC93_02290 [Planctomycetota bacterium]
MTEPGAMFLYAESENGWRTLVNVERISAMEDRGDSGTFIRVDGTTYRVEAALHDVIRACRIHAVEAGGEIQPPPGQTP